MVTIFTPMLTSCSKSDTDKGNYNSYIKSGDKNNKTFYENLFWNIRPVPKVLQNSGDLKRNSINEYFSFVFWFTLVIIPVLVFCSAYGGFNSEIRKLSPFYKNLYLSITILIFIFTFFLSLLYANISSILWLSGILHVTIPIVILYTAFIRTNVVDKFIVNSRIEETKKTYLIQYNKIKNQINYGNIG